MKSGAEGLEPPEQRGPGWSGRSRVRREEAVFQKGPPWRPGFDPSSEGQMALHLPALPKPDHTALVQAPSSQACTQHPRHPLNPRAQAQDSLDPGAPGLGTEGERAWPGSIPPSCTG